MAKRTARINKRSGAGTNSWELRLYVAGDNVYAKNALTRIKKICIVHLLRNCHIEVIDLRKNPEIALKEHIVALPTLVRIFPGPKKILIGDLMDEEKVLRCLEINKD